VIGVPAKSWDVSVVVVTCNPAPHLARALDSVLAHEPTRPFVTIRENHCSTDGTRAWFGEGRRRFIDWLECAGYRVQSVWSP
jgi:GT2 family glycosyltransferase